MRLLSPRFSPFLTIAAWFLFVYATLAAGSTTQSHVPPAPISNPDQSVRLYPKAISDVIDDSEKLFTILGVLGAGFWVYLNFLRGRTYLPKLELKVSGEFEPRGEYKSLTATVSLKNVGLSKVLLSEEGTACTISISPTPRYLTSPVAVTEWKMIDISDIFTSHHWVEPGESINEQRLVVIPDGDYFAFRLDARVIAPRFIGDKKEWNAMAVLPAPSPGGDDKDLSSSRRPAMQEPLIQRNEDPTRTEEIERAKREQERREKERKERERKEQDHKRERK